MYYMRMKCFVTARPYTAHSASIYNACSSFSVVPHFPASRGLQQRSSAIYNTRSSFSLVPDLLSTLPDVSIERYLSTPAAASVSACQNLSSSISTRSSPIYNARSPPSLVPDLISWVFVNKYSRLYITLAHRSVWFQTF